MNTERHFKSGFKEWTSAIYKRIFSFTTVVDLNEDLFSDPYDMKYGESLLWNTLLRSSEVWEKAGCSEYNS